MVFSTKIITIGDSYSAGIGINIHENPQETESLWQRQKIDGIEYNLGENGFIFGRCTRYLETTPGPRLAKEQNLESVVLACGGATIPNLQDQFDLLLEEYPEERAVNFRGSTILFTIGLNDTESEDGHYWFRVLVNCLAKFFDGGAKCARRNENQLSNTDDIQSNLLIFVERLVAEASEAKIRIFGYGKLYQRKGKDCEAFGVSNELADLLDEDYFGGVNSVSASIAATIKTANPKVDIKYVDPTDYLTVGSCNPNKDLQHLNGFSLIGLPINAICYHPSQLGYDQYYHALNDSLWRK